MIILRGHAISNENGIFMNSQYDDDHIATSFAELLRRSHFLRQKIEQKARQTSSTYEESCPSASSGRFMIASNHLTASKIINITVGNRSAEQVLQIAENPRYKKLKKAQHKENQPS